MPCKSLPLYRVPDKPKLMLTSVNTLFCLVISHYI